MKKADVKIGGEYYAKVTNKKVVVRIDAENASGGWDATNLTTNKKIRIKTAGRLQGPARDAAVANDSPKPRVRKRVDKAKSEAPTGEKKLSCVGAALRVLGESEEPLSTKEMIETMEAKGYWSSPGGKTPHATLYSAILRDLAKGDDSRFVKTDRGRFAARA
ncbi:winged helix-turn-helix domain-containing protein [Bremerella sp.]|uniref:winged helix-turn-helix domain-containing protein n=1 Tax=Bremerella sp. TaxID=2795602 RepID=UPI00391D25C6